MLDFEKIFQLFNEAVYRGEMEKLNYKSWKNIKMWITKGEWEMMEISREWVRCREGNDHPYQYHDEERIFVGPYDYDKTHPNPEELDPNDNSFGTWLNRVLNKEKLISTNLNDSFADIAYSASNVKDALNQVSNALIANKGTISILDSYADCSIGTIATDISKPQMEINSNGLYINGKKFDDYLEETVKNIHEKEKENNKMMKFDFGPVDSSVHMSMYGMAIKNASGTYVAYDANSKQIMDVDILNFEGANKFIYKMPVALGDVAVGDVVIHMRKPMIVIAKQDKSFIVVDVYNGEEKTIIPARSPFGWDFMTKVVSLFNFNGTADASNPFGNMLPLLLLSDSKSKDDNLLPLMLMAGGNLDMSNPMMLYALCGNGTMDNTALMLAMASGLFNKPATTTCSGNCACHKAD